MKHLIQYRMISLGLIHTQYNYEEQRLKLKSLWNEVIRSLIRDYLDISNF